MSGFLSTLNVSKFDCGCLLLGVAINAYDFSKVAEEGIDFDNSELFLRYILDIDRIASSVNHATGLHLARLVSKITTTGCAHAHHGAHRRIRILLVHEIEPIPVI